MRSKLDTSEQAIIDEGAELWVTYRDNFDNPEQLKHTPTQQVRNFARVIEQFLARYAQVLVPEHWLTFRFALSLGILCHSILMRFEEDPQHWVLDALEANMYALQSAKRCLPANEYGIGCLVQRLKIAAMDAIDMWDECGFKDSLTLNGFLISDPNLQVLPRAALEMLQQQANPILALYVQETGSPKKFFNVSRF